ncbi:MAG: hypothetical protein P3M75_00145 [Candidatus Hodgkinia cicadicola]|nr:MAG: hypothetical protein P3M75_00145 [Candidatus Hodgkinia cicadicola]
MISFGKSSNSRIRTSRLHSWHICYKVNAEATNNYWTSSRRTASLYGRDRKLPGYELMEKMKTQPPSLGTKTTMDSVEAIDTSAIPYHVLTTLGKVYVANCLIIAMGVFQKRWCLQNETAPLIVQHVMGFFYKSKSVAVIGGGNTAVTDVLYLSKFQSVGC